MPVSHLSGAKLIGEKFHRWRHDNWPIREWVILDATPDIAYVNQSFFLEWIYNMIQVHSHFRRNKSTSLARSLRDLIEAHFALAYACVMLASLVWAGRLFPFTAYSTNRQQFSMVWTLIDQKNDVKMFKTQSVTTSRSWTFWRHFYRW